MISCGTIVLAGGVGKRLGQRKPYVQLDTKKLLQYVLDTAVQLSDEVIVVFSNDEDLYSHFDNIHSRIIPVRDLENGIGPMMGIYSGMKKMSADYSVVLPCDSPFINIPLMRYLILGAENFDAVIPIWLNGYVEPLHSVYRISSSIQAIESTLKYGEKSILDMIKRLKKINYIPVDELRKFDKELRTFFNINYPEDLVTAYEIQDGKDLRGIN